MKRRIEAGLIARVQALLNARQQLPGQKTVERPKLQVAVVDDGTDLMLYDEISWFGICAQDVADALDGVTGALNVRINSPGGDVFDAIAIYNMLLDHPGNVTVTVDGLAASAASFVAMAGDTIRMNRASQMMIHDAMTAVYGNAAYMTEVADLLDKLSDTIAGIYADRSGVAAADWRTRMRAETWFSAEEAVKAGLATEMAPSRQSQEAAPAAVAASFDLSVFTYAGRLDAPAPPTNVADPEPDPAADPAPAEPVTPDPPADPEPAEPDPVADPEPEPDPPDDWAAATAHLTTSPVDEWASITEALK